MLDEDLIIVLIKSNESDVSNIIITLNNGLMLHLAGSIFKTRLVNNPADKQELV